MNSQFNVKKIKLNNFDNFISLLWSNTSFAFLVCLKAGKSSQNSKKQQPPEIFEIRNGDNVVTRTNFVEPSMILSNMPELNSIRAAEEVDSVKLKNLDKHVDDSLLWIARKYGDKIMLTYSDRKPKTSKKKDKKSSAAASQSKQKTIEIAEDWQGPPPWEPSLGGDGCPKFLCDVMVCN